MKSHDKNVAQSTLLDSFAAFAEYPDKFLTFDDGFRSLTLTYREVASAAYAFARRLAAERFEKGDKIILCGESRPGWVIAFWGALLQGVVLVPLEPSSSEATIDKIRQATSAKLTLRNADLEALESHRAAPVTPLHVTPEDLVQILFTSGSTAEPKGVLITHRNILANLRPVEQEILKYRPWGTPFYPLRFVNLLPLSHMFGQAMTTFIPPVLKAEVIFLRSQNPRDVARQVKRRRSSVIIAVPKMLELMADAVQLDFPESSQARRGRGWLRAWWQYRRVHRKLGWKFWAFVVGAAPLPPDVEAFWNKLGYIVIQGYGLTETAPIVSLNHPFRARQGSVGKAIAGVEIRIAEDGEILVRGDNVSQGYFNETQPSPRPDGWLATGDIGQFDAQGNLHIRGRKKEMIVLPDGRNIFPEDLEKTLLAQSGVEDCAVVGIEHDRRELPFAVLSLASGADGEAILRAANHQLESHQQIAAWRAWPGPEPLPRTPGTKKLKRRAIRDWVLTGAPPAAKGPASSVADLLAQFTPGRQLDASTKLDGLGLSSLDRIQFMLAAEEKLGLSLDEAAFSRAATIAELERATPSARIEEIEFPRWAQSRFAQWHRRLHLPLWILPLARLFVWLRVEGREHLDAVSCPRIFAANHQSYFDTPAIFMALPSRHRYRTAVAMAKEFFEAHFYPGRFPAARVFTNRLNYLLAALFFFAFPLPRTESGTKQALQYAGELASAGNHILIFPEGEHTNDGSIGRFHPGVILLAQRLKLPIQPIRLRGLDQVLHRTWKMAKPGRVTIAFGPALDVTGLGVEAATKRLHDSITSL
jgi:long-chain acyl-CoA synthetase